MDGDDGPIACHKCKYCNNIFTSGATRLKSHLQLDDKNGLIPENDRKAHRFLFLEQKKQKAIIDEEATVGAKKRKADLNISSFVDSVSAETNAELDKQLTLAFCSGHIPFSFIENEYFRQFISTIRPSYK